MMTNQLDAAIAYVERELKVVPNHEQGWLNLAGLYLMNKDFARSEAAGKQLVAKNPKSWEGWQHLGNLYEAVPKPAEAEDAYRKAIALAPKEWKPLTNLGALLVQSNDKAKHAEAKRLLERAEEVAPEGEHRPRYNLALALARLGDKKGARAVARSSRRICPKRRSWKRTCVSASAVRSSLPPGKLGAAFGRSHGDRVLDGAEARHRQPSDREAERPAGRGVVQPLQADREILPGRERGLGRAARLESAASSAASRNGTAFRSATRSRVTLTMRGSVPGG